MISRTGNTPPNVPKFVAGLFVVKPLGDWELTAGARHVGERQANNNNGIRLDARALYLFHRWAGIVLCLFFALWLVSGIFMMYVEFPQLSRPERLVGSRLLNSGQPFYRVADRDGDTRLVAGNESATTLPDAKTMLALAPKLIPGAPLIEASVLSAYDNYYYSRHPERGDRPLPIIRVRFDDPRHTWFHLDPLTGQILDRSTRTNRVYRWLYNGLHSFDIWWLWQHRPLWDICVIVFSPGARRCA